MGILDGLGINVNDVPDDPFGFNNDYWPVAILAAASPNTSNNPFMQELKEFVNPHSAISSSGKQFGTMLTFRILDERYQYLGGNNPNQMPGQLGFGQWFQLPAPEWAQHQVPFDKDSADGQKLVFNWVALLKSLSFGADKMGAADLPDVLGRTCLAKIKATQDENGYWQFRVYGLKAGPAEGSAEGMSTFNPKPPNGGAAGLSAMERALLEESDNA